MALASCGRPTRSCPRSREPPRSRSRVEVRSSATDPRRRFAARQGSSSLRMHSSRPSTSTCCGFRSCTDDRSRRRRPQPKPRSRSSAQRGPAALWPGEDPIGKTVRVNIEPAQGKVVADTVRSMRVIRELDETATEVTIVGVAQDVVNGFVYQGLDPAFLYLPTHPGSARATTVMLRSRGSLQVGIRAIAAAARQPGPDGVRCARGG